MGLQHREMIEVEYEGEQIEVWNFLNVTPAYQFRGGNPVMEAFHNETRITAGGSMGEPVEYITEWVANEMWAELGIDRFEELFGIDVVDVESDDVIVL